MRDLGFSVPWPPLNSYPSVTLIEGGSRGGRKRRVVVEEEFPAAKNKGTMDLRLDQGRLKLGVEPHELLSKLLVSPLITPIVVPYIIPYITPIKEFRL